MDLFTQFGKEFNTDEEPASDAVSQVVRQFNAPAILSSEDDAELLEIDKCLSKAAYYKAIVRDGVIQEDGSSEASEINAEARLWARQRMANLVGRGPIAAAPVQSPFTEPQTTILKEIADRVLATKGVVPTRQVPIVKQLQITVPKKTVATTQKPQANQQLQKAKSQSKQVPDKKLFVPGRDVKGKIEYDRIPFEEVFRDDDDQLYKFVPHPQKDNARVKLKVTNQVRNRAAVPFPATKQGMEAIMQAQAMDSLNEGGSANTIFPDMKGGLDVYVAAAAGALANQDKE